MIVEIRIKGLMQAALCYHKGVRGSLSRGIGLMLMLNIVCPNKGLTQSTMHSETIHLSKQSHQQFGSASDVSTPYEHGADGEKAAKGQPNSGAHMRTHVRIPVTCGKFPIH